MVRLHVPSALVVAPLLLPFVHSLTVAPVTVGLVPPHGRLASRSVVACAPPAEDTSSGIQVSLRDPETDRSLECHVLQTTDVGGQMYASMTPIDTPVAVAALDDGMMVEIDDPTELDALFPTAQAVCSEMDLACAADLRALTCVRTSPRPPRAHAAAAGCCRPR